MRGIPRALVLPSLGNREALVGMVGTIEREAAGAVDRLGVTLPAIPHEIPVLHFTEALRQLLHCLHAHRMHLHRIVRLRGHFQEPRHGRRWSPVVYVQVVHARAAHGIVDGDAIEAEQQQRLRVVGVIDKGYKPTVHSMAMERYCPNRQLCEEFLAYIQSAEAQRLVRQAGYAVPAGVGR